MSKRTAALLLEDMLEALNKIRKYTQEMNFDVFKADDKTIDAVIRNFEIIGEAANRLDPEFRNQHSKIEWNRIRGFRNRIVHNYFGVDIKIVWSIIENDIDTLSAQLNILKEDIT